MRTFWLRAPRDPFLDRLRLRGPGVSFCPDSEFIAESFQVSLDGGFKLRGYGELTFQIRDKAAHLFLKRFAVVLDVLGTDIATGCEDVAVGDNFLEV